MARSPRRGDHPRLPCADLHADDDVDPRELLSRETRSRRAADHRTLALCSEVAKRLSLVFASDLADDALRDAEVIGVAPAPDASRLCVTLAVAAAPPADDRTELLRRLGALTPFLRQEVATAIRRRRTPDLRFLLVPGDHGRPAEVER